MRFLNVVDSNGETVFRVFYPPQWRNWKIFLWNFEHYGFQNAVKIELSVMMIKDLYFAMLISWLYSPGL